MKALLTFFTLIWSFTGYSQFNLEAGKSNAQSPPYKNLEWLTFLNPSTPQLTVNTNQRLWNLVNPFIKDDLRNDLTPRTNNGWERVDLFGALNTNESYRFSGRIRALDFSKGRLLIGAASGGLWKWDFINNTLPVSMGEFQINSPAIGAIATHPEDQDIILVGTGEPNISSGTGLWKSTDGGNTWKNISLGANTPEAFTKIIYPKPGLVYFSASSGTFKSIDDGETWTKLKQGYQWDIAVDHSNTDIIYTGQQGGGIFKSVNGGIDWTVLRSILPTSGFTRLNFSICKTNPNFLFACFIKQDNSTLGVYRTEDAGVTWKSSLLQDSQGQIKTNIHNDQGWYDNMVSVSPTNPKHALVGGVQLYFSGSGTLFRENGLTRHADIHSAAWSEDGQYAFVGTDGGLFLYKDGATFDNVNNKIANALPITQFTGIGVGKTDGGIMVGGSQDNGVIWRQRNVWHSISGDGGPSAVDPTDSDILYSSNGVYGENLSFHPWYKKGDLPWADRATSLTYQCDQWYTQSGTDYNKPSTWYYNACEFLFESKDNGSTFTKLNLNSPLSFQIGHFGVSKGIFPKIYCGIQNNSAVKLMIYNTATQTFEDKSFAFQGNGSIWPRMFPSRKDDNVVYAGMVGFGNGTNKKKIYKSIDAGDNWLNISGNLPDVPVTSVLENPYNTNQIYIATDGFGIFRTRDGGVSYEKWDEDLPLGAKGVTLDYIDETASGGKFYIVLGTYGHSILKREIPKEELVSVQDVKDNLEFEILNAGFRDDQLIIDLQTKHKGTINIVLLDILGHTVGQIPKLKINSGIVQRNLNCAGLQKGYYVLSIIYNNKIVQSKKVTKL